MPQNSHNHKRIARRAIAGPVILVLQASFILGYAAAAETLRGRVTDGTKSPIPGAQVRIVAPDGAISATGESRVDGSFQIPSNSLTGSYLEVTAKGFSLFRDHAAKQTDWEITLQPSGLRQQVIVSAELVSGGTDLVERIPGAVEVVDAATFRNTRLFTSEEVLRKVSGVYARPEEGFGLRPNISIRGLNPTRSSQVLLLEDGVPLAYAPYGDNASYYHPPVDRFEGLEVVKGAGQILYGPRTVGGVVNYVTPVIPDRWGGSLSMTGGNRDYLNGHARLGGTLRGGTGLMIDATRKQGEGSRDNVRSGLTDLNGKLQTLLTPRQTLSLKANTYQEDSRITYSGSRSDEYLAAPRGNPFRNDNFEGNRYGFSAVHSLTVSPGLIQSTTVYGTIFQRDWWRQSSNSNQRPNTNCGGMANLHISCGNEGRLREYHTWGIEPKAHWTAGRFDHDFGFRYHSELQDRRQLNGTSPLARTGVIVEDNERRTWANAGFWQSRVKLGKFAVTPGVRVENVRYRRTNRLANSGAGVFGNGTVTRALPAIAASYSPASSLTIFAGAHRGFAPPRAEDIITNAGGFVELDPELSWNYEAGARWRAGRAFSLDATYFRLDYENQIIPASLAGGVGAVLTNAGRTLHEGVEVSNRWEWRNAAGSGQTFFARTAWTWLPVARFTSERFSTLASTVRITGNRLPYASRHLTTASLGWIGRRGENALVEAVQTGRQFGDDLNTVNSSADGQRGALPGHVLWNATLNVPVEAWRTTMFVTAKNVFDRTVIVDRARGILPNSPRLVQAGVRFDF